MVVPARLPVLDLAAAATPMRRHAVASPTVVGADDLVPLARARHGPTRLPAPLDPVPAGRPPATRSADVARRFVPTRQVRIAVLTGVLIGVVGHLVEERFLRGARAPASEAIEVPAPIAPHRAIASV